MEIDIDVPAPYIELFQPTKNWRHMTYYGGRSSGKSTTIALSILVKATASKLRILCVRETQNSIAESVHQLMADLIDKHKLPNWEVTKDEIRNTKTGSNIIFKGVHNNTQAIKSLEGIDICWVEEAQSVSMDSIDVLIPTIRKEGSYFIWSFNPLTSEDPVWIRIAKNPDYRTLVKKVNSDAIERLLSPEVIHEREKMRADNPELFEHVWLGEPLTAKTGSVFGKQLATAREEGRITKVPYDGSAPVYTAWDLGIGDATAIWFFQIIGREIHYIDHYESSGEDLGHYLSVLRAKPYEYAKHFLPHDAKQRELQTNKTRVEFFADNGFPNVEVLRPTNFTPGQDDIDMVARPKLSLCWFDKEKCNRGIECLRAYHYDYDEKNRILKAKPEHDWSSHSSSAFIYSLIADTEFIQTTQTIKFKTFVPKEFRDKETKNSEMYW